MDRFLVIQVLADSREAMADKELTAVHGAISSQDVPHANTETVRLIRNRVKRTAESARPCSAPAHVRRRIAAHSDRRKHVCIDSSVFLKVQFFGLANPVILFHTASEFF